ncbi:hypothetical protein CWI38_0219p0050 [Hamiltosporidium tvaerminnensis]|uniref:Leucine-rich repeat-containing protein n=1 Tax=Hamiltosporidium tvaerminnensis TaxID=1176355 RepID=A0A4Q9LZF1_9MICR|nr:hypothetical protein CWI38_0219p0050 [Hamiltosporidium tvaerminnensis]
MNYYKLKINKIFVTLLEFLIVLFNIFPKCHCNEIYESSFIILESRICFYNFQVIFNEKKYTYGVRCIFDTRNEPENIRNLSFICIYNDRNYINFDYLDALIVDNILNMNISGKFLSKFNLIYYLKITQTNDSFIENLNLKDLYNLLLVLDELKAKQNKNLKHFTLAVVFRLIYGNDFRSNLLLFRNKLKKICCINFYIANQVLIGFFKFFFVNISLFEGNFVASFSKYENFKFKPKNFLPENIYFAIIGNEIIIKVERILSDKICFIFFQFLSIKMDINHLVLKNIDLGDDNISRTKFKIFKIESFIIIKIWNVSGYSSHFFSKLNTAINSRIKFISLETFELTTYEIETLLQDNSLISLEMNYKIISNSSFRLRNFHYCNDTLRILDLSNVLIENEWWLGLSNKFDLKILIICSFDMIFLKNIINTMHMWLFHERLQRLEFDELSYDSANRVLNKIYLFKSLCSLKMHSMYSVLLVITDFIAFIYDLKNISEIDLMYVNLTKNALQILSTMKNLEKLSLKSSYLQITNILGIDLSFFYRNIKYLNFSNTMIGDIIFGVIKDCESIKYLNLKRSKFNLKCFQSLKIFKSRQTIEYLNISHTDFGVNRDVSIFLNYINLKKLKLHNCNLSCGFFKINPFKEILKSIEYLYISKNSLNLNDINIIFSLRNLKCLDISNCTFKDFNINSIILRLIIYSPNDRNYSDQNFSSKDKLLYFYHFEELKPIIILDLNKHNGINSKIFDLFTSKGIIQNKYYKIFSNNIEIIVELEKIL